MSSRPQLNPQSVITNGDMSQATLTSLVTIIQKVSMFSYSIAWTGSSPVGTAVIQVSNDYSENAAGGVANPGTWNTLVFESGGSTTNSIAISGNSGNAMVDILQTGTYAVRVQYTKVSGTGSLNVVIAGKVS
jgi:hypothetical protein